MRLTTEFATYVAGEYCVCSIPHGYKRDGTKIGILHCHAAGELSITPFSGAAGGKTYETGIMAAMAAVYPLISFDAGIFGAGGITDSNNWGNANGVARAAQAVTRLQAAAGCGAKAGKVIVVGMSMGHALAINYSSANAGNVQAIMGILPVNDLNDIRDNNRGGYQASISNAFGTGAWISAGNPALGAPGNPALNTANIKNIPHRLYYDLADTICTPATALALQTNLNAATTTGTQICTAVTSPSQGHTDAAFQQYSVSDIMSWLAAYGG